MKFADIKTCLDLYETVSVGLPDHQSESDFEQLYRTSVKS